MMMSIAFLAWVTPEEASTYYSSFHKKLKIKKTRTSKGKHGSSTCMLSIKKVKRPWSK